jgi:hypothetical protein
MEEGALFVQLKLKLKLFIYLGEAKGQENIPSLAYPKVPEVP